LYLKRMELFGFKSFAEKSELELSPGIATIIGPNGCGKSNLVDAARWALGEQSVKSLRGTRMEEVIFSGSENRKPLNFAEVSLSFSGASNFLNLEYDEITITRRLFRSGESEYYINKSPCRLKDVTELFLDTGLGKDVYSVIGQGRVDEIINNRPEERREIFEEAAGIFKYKMRKREARRRLDETRENLVRVQDLIFELETQVEPLHAQAEVTRQYRALKEKIDGEEKKLLSYKLHQSREQLNKVNKQLQNVNDALLAASSQEGLDEKEIQDLKNRLQDQVNQKREHEQRLNQVSRTLEQQEHELKLLGERENRYREQIEQNRQRIKQLELLMQELSEQKEKAEQDLCSKRDYITQLNEDLVKLRRDMENLENSALPNEVEKQQERIYQAGVRKEAATSTIEELKRRLERIDTQKKNVEKDKSELEEKLVQLEQKADTIKAREKEVSEELRAAEENEARQVKEKEKVRSELENLSAREQKQKETLHGINSRLSLLREQDSALSGYYRGVKEIMQARSSLPGIVGPVADLIEIDGEYIQAVEASLGGALQYLVAESEEAVHRAIKYLKNNNRGWATFLPLDILHRASEPLQRYPGWRDLNGVIGKASDLVAVDSAYRNAVNYLMASILVCRTLDDASRAARFINHSCRVVTLDGEMINPGGIIRGGSVTKRSAGMPLGRRKEIENLEKQQAEAEQELNRISSELDRVKKRLASAEKKMEEAAAERKNEEGRLSGVQKEADALEHEQSVLNDRIETGKRSFSELEAEEEDINKRLGELQSEIDHCQEEIKTLENELAGKKEDYQNYLDNKKKLENQITEVLVRISSYQEQRDTLTGRIEEIEANIKKPAREIEEKEKEFEKLQQDLADNTAEQDRIKARMEDLNEEKAGLIADLDRKSEQVNQVEAELIEHEEKVKRRQNQVARQEKRERQLSMEQTRLQTEINYQEMRFKELFGSLDLVELDDQFDPEESRHLIDNYREDIEALGEVNLGAIEELARLEERINFLKDQKDDLQKGEESLCKVLNEIDQRMKYYFKNAFEAIRENFKQTFQELFEGGQVMLKMTDTEDILEAGIEIIAQPPGKKLQNITLLSAGEKVLTAIALVFAILRYKPAPFYLLDEVESTLDDANLARFTRFLKQSSEQAQFIMITHRKRTMEEADVLYGVTMSEPGISRLMSLRLEDEKIVRESK